MIREEVAEKLLPIVEAWLKGKQIQYRDNEGNWKDLRKDWCPIGFDEIRIKSEPKYRPFHSKEECWQEMLKHQPFGFIVNKYNNDYCGICRVFKDEKGISGITFTSNSYSNWDMEIAYDRFNFADGTPFGIKEE